MTKYHTEPANRTTARFTAKLMANGKRNLSDRILRQALARAEATAHRPGLEVLEAALRNATPIIEVKPRREDTHKMAEANRAFSHFKW
jgi:small subunit ribosomal protein S7